MKNQKSFKKLAAVYCLFLCFFIITETLAAEVSRISKEELQAMLGNPEVIIIDVRASGDWTSSESKVKGAVREDPGKVNAWIDKYPKDKTLIFY